ncbi:hypothetical protein BO221_06220 [Archangium sp. Cb G35]|uniref:hypothetical protein n=1 Tax=Archangium sp. Cb G35 TaxID=1920190 RepID=UPI000936CDA2|nr:hypothetical protein [Archangium sp. Cb G35]OJT27558.1 hypothetical protein BO221_06220 [Archangium sp. Cb G35]
MSTDLEQRERVRGAAVAARVRQKLAARDFAGVQSRASAPHARLAHLSVEFFPPRFFVSGAAHLEDRLTPVFEGFRHSRLSMRSDSLRG